MSREKDNHLLPFTGSHSFLYWPFLQLVYSLVNYGAVNQVNYGAVSPIIDGGRDTNYIYLPMKKCNSVRISTIALQMLKVNVFPKV